MARKKTKDALELIRRDAGRDKSLRAMIEEEQGNAQVARMIYDARTKAGLTQGQLARLALTTQPVIARMEDADYGGHSLSLICRIANALNQRVEVHFVATRRRLQA